MAYPYPSTLNISNFINLKLTQSNFLLWKTQFMGLVESQDMLGFLNGSIPVPSHILPSAGDTADGNPPQAINPRFSEWRKSDKLLRGWITGTLSEETLGLVVGLDTSAEVWTALQDTYAGSTQEHEFALEQKLRRHHRDRFSTMQEYIRVFKEVCDEFAAIGKPLPDKEKVFTLLTGLGKDYEAFVTTMLKPPRPTFYELMSHLKSHEIIRSMNTDSALPSSHNQVFFAQRNGRGSFRGRGGFRGGGRHHSFTSRGRGFSHSGSISTDISEPQLSSLSQALSLPILPPYATSQPDANVQQRELYLSQSLARNSNRTTACTTERVITSASSLARNSNRNTACINPSTCYCVMFHYQDADTFSAWHC
ncbi:hypothetical protein COLO4_20536 [Corchorus olitorius]|uniref:Retrotransposon Copia-like N-terminal domain-containing protein n=1 Tax=Corchorus olitorius TaxID=93759 RepID=A0A1R3IZ64_9ROSI|nr:hypothetical protein COLO4_20536 [Corchorus olitorius]